MKAIILSAGQGSRMYPLTVNTPKCLIDIGQGKSVLESQLDALHECGILEVYVVAGYKIEQVEAKIGGYQNGDMQIRILHNPFYATTNNIVSLWVAHPWLEGECISINGDDIFKPIVIGSLLEARGDIVMTIDRKDEYDSDDMLVITEGGFIRDVGKDLDHNLANGESVGIIKYSSRGVEMLKDTLDLMLREAPNHQKFYLKALQTIMCKGYPVVACEVNEHDWAEIDFHPDVSDVRAKVESFVQRMQQ